MPAVFAVGTVNVNVPSATTAEAPLTSLPSVAASYTLYVAPSTAPVTVYVASVSLALVNVKLVFVA